MQPTPQTTIKTMITFKDLPEFNNYFTNDEQCKQYLINSEYIDETVLKNTKLPLKKWFIALHIFKKTYQPQKHIALHCNVSKTTALRMVKCLIIAMLRHPIQPDETISRGRHTNKRPNNTPGRSLHK